MLRIGGCMASDSDCLKSEAYARFEEMGEEHVRLRLGDANMTPMQRMMMEEWLGGRAKEARKRQEAAQAEGAAIAARTAEAASRAAAAADRAASAAESQALTAKRALLIAIISAIIATIALVISISPFLPSHMP